MTDYQTETAFTISVTPDEAALVDACAELSAALIEDAQRASLPESGDAFRAAFPPLPGDDDALSGFRAIFADGEYPDLGCEIAVAETDEGHKVTFSGSAVDLDAVAELVRRCCASALPVRFGWAATCSRYRNDAFGGGTIEITRFDVRDVLGERHGELLHVLATRDAGGETLYWHEEAGFGPLDAASVYTDKEAEHVTVIAADEPFWVTLPQRTVPLHL
jgi:hypothetical protein